MKFDPTKHNAWMYSGLILSMPNWTTQTRVDRAATERAIKEGILKAFIDPETDLVHVSIRELDRASRFGSTHQHIFHPPQLPPQPSGVLMKEKTDLEIEAERERNRVLSFTWEKLEERLAKPEAIIRAALKTGPCKPSLKAGKRGISGKREDFEILCEQVQVHPDPRALCEGSCS